MNNNKYLNEENYQKTNAKVKHIGKILLIIGAVILVFSILLTIIGFAGFSSTATDSFNSFNTLNAESGVQAVQNMASSSFGNIGTFAAGGFMGTIGFMLMAVGGGMLLIAHRREITAYTAQQVIPIAKEGIDTMAPTFGKAAGEIAKDIKKGLNDADKE